MWGRKEEEEERKKGKKKTDKGGLRGSGEEKKQRGGEVDRVSRPEMWGYKFNRPKIILCLLPEP